jgi:phosphoserine aminotransferase
VHVCLNETITGVEFLSDPEWNSLHPPLVADATSTLLSRPVDVARYGVVFASGGKNLPAGITVAIARNDLLTGRRVHPMCPAVLDYRANGGALQPVASAFESMPNTPPVFACPKCSTLLP